MKKILFICTLAATVCHIFSGCDKDNWGNGDPALEHVYYVGFEDWGDFKNSVKYEVTQGSTVTVPVQYHSERVRSYDVTTKFYVMLNTVATTKYKDENGKEQTEERVIPSPLQLGTDFEIVDEKGNKLTPDSGGAYTLTWPKAKKSVQNIGVKALNGAKGSFTIRTFHVEALFLPSNDLNSASGTKREDISTIVYDQLINNQTNEYEVRSFSQNYRVMVTIK